jgi:hypothetical protein
VSNQTLNNPLIIDTTRSPYARLRPVPLTAVTLNDQFWAWRLRLLRQVILPSQYQQCEKTGRIDNFRRAAGQKPGDFQGYFFNDADVYKWLEAAAWALALEPAGYIDLQKNFRRDLGIGGWKIKEKIPSSPHPGPKWLKETFLSTYNKSGRSLFEQIEGLIDLIVAAQQADGYLNTYFTFERSAERWSNLRDKHELYCAGHLIQAAIAHYRATGSERLLEVATRFADHIGAVFGPASGQLALPDGHPEIELALVELARATGVDRYLHQAQFFLDQRGQGLLGGQAYHQDHQPFRELDRLAGHAVRALYLAVGAADVYLETGEAALLTTLERLWGHMTRRQIYINGGLGSRYQGEAFGPDYELPNSLAYTETCAAIASVMWNWRMLLITGQAGYADVLERTLYNAILPGISLDGLAYFYVNPLASEGSHRRQPWFQCACCPPNIARLLATLPSYFYSLSQDNSIWLHVYGAGTARFTLPDDRPVSLVQTGRYPWDGEISLEVNGQGEFSLWLRIPGWAKSAAVTLNGQPVSALIIPGTYLQVERHWQPGDIVRLHLPMPVQLIESHPYVTENRGQIALMRGPILYCLEQVDQPGLDLRQVVLPLAPDQVHASYDPELLGGVVSLRVPVKLIKPGPEWHDRLYRPASAQVQPEPNQSTEITAVPYFAWANRQAGPMQVWLRRS